MPFRAPKNVWEWVLLFAPALVIWAATAISWFFPSKGEGGPYLLGAFYGSIAALIISFVAGYCFTKPDPTPHVRRVAGIFTGTLVAVLNFTVAFGGCAAVLN